MYSTILMHNSCTSKYISRTAVEWCVPLSLLINVGGRNAVAGGVAAGEVLLAAGEVCFAAGGVRLAAGEVRLQPGSLTPEEPPHGAPKLDIDDHFIFFFGPGP
jgi:hypothetical protein